MPYWPFSPAVGIARSIRRGFWYYVASFGNRKSIVPSPATTDFCDTAEGDREGSPFTFQSHRVIAAPRFELIVRSRISRTVITCFPITAPVSHQKRPQRDATNALDFSQMCRKINGSDLYSAAHNGLVGGSSPPGPTTSAFAAVRLRLLPSKKPLIYHYKKSDDIRRHPQSSACSHKI